MGSRIKKWDVRTNWYRRAKFPGKVKEWIRKKEEEWDWEAIGGWITEEQKELIRRILVSARGGRDRFVWTKERSGKYTVKSRYFLMKESKQEKEISRPSSSFIVDKKVWKEIWNLQVPNKINNFLWRLCTNSLVTNMNLYKRKVRQDPVCAICKKEEETVEHLCFTCEWTALVWFAGCYR